MLKETAFAIGRLCVFLMLFCLWGCGNSDVNSEREEVIVQESALVEDDDEIVPRLSYIGAWVDDEQKRIIIFEKGGEGSILSFSSDGIVSGEVPVAVNSLQWENSDNAINVYSNLGDFELTATIQDEITILTLGNKVYHAFDDDIAHNYLSEYETNSNKEEQNAKTKEEDAVETKVLGTSIEKEFVQITLDEIDIANELYPDDTSDVYLFFEGEEGYEFIYLRGRIKNTGEEDIDSRDIHCNVTINDKYSYEAEMTIMVNPSSMTDFLLQPFEEASYYVYTRLPDDAIRQKHSGCFQIGFNDHFLSRGSPYDYNYIIDF